MCADGPSGHFREWTFQCWLSWCDYGWERDVCHCQFWRDCFCNLVPIWRETVSWQMGPAQSKVQFYIFFLKIKVATVKYYSFVIFSDQTSLLYVYGRGFNFYRMCGWDRSVFPGWEIRLYCNPPSPTSFRSSCNKSLIPWYWYWNTVPAPFRFLICKNFRLQLQRTSQLSPRIRPSPSFPTWWLFPLPAGKK